MAHAVHSVADALEYLPNAQFAHAVETDAPLVDEYLPAVQASHELAPVDVTNWPGTHDEHAVRPVDAVNMPAVQSEQTVEADAPVVLE